MFLTKDNTFLYICADKQPCMITSMTGYGRTEITFREDKIVIEIRSVNGKSADINLKSALIAKSKELEIRQLLTSQLQRGSIDIFVYLDGNKVTERPISKERFLAYYHQIREFQKELQLGHQSDLLSAILRIPEVMEDKHHEPDQELWSTIVQGIELAIKQLNLFREQEGVSLARDILQRVEQIESYIYKVEEHEVTRIEKVKERLLNRLSELAATVQPDHNRFEHELIYYLEKLDITEEKVRLRQHCAFFKETALHEIAPGRKLLFIVQEMGREINTIGSKANHAVMQQCAVMMKDELEKIKEQLLNIL